MMVLRELVRQGIRRPGLFALAAMTFLGAAMPGRAELPPLIPREIRDFSLNTTVIRLYKCGPRLAGTWNPPQQIVLSCCSSLCERFAT